MADTGEKNQIAGRANAKAAETMRESKQMDAKKKASEANEKEQSQPVEPKAPKA